MFLSHCIVPFFTLIAPCWPDWRTWATNFHILNQIIVGDVRDHELQNNLLTQVIFQTHVACLKLCTIFIFSYSTKVDFHCVVKEPLLLIYQRLNVHTMWHMLLWHEWVQCGVAVYDWSNRFIQNKIFDLNFLETRFSPRSQTGVYFKLGFVSCDLS